eukprot:m.52422 g.52422  ORF g.52422 m.52422 type:complete len:209 (+) comp12295_c0_seq2:219-845(+)
MARGLRQSHVVFRVAAFLPVCFVLGVLIYGYFVYIGIFIAQMESNIALRAVLAVVFHLLCGLFLVSYNVTIFTLPLIPPSEFDLSPEDLALLQTRGDTEHIRRRAMSLGLVTHDGTLNPRFCHHCEIIKPDRAHHCSSCGTCVLKMDHHCPWVDNCVGLHNYKAFLLFLFYGLYRGAYGARRVEHDSQAIFIVRFNCVEQDACSMRTR